MATSRSVELYSRDSLPPSWGRAVIQFRDMDYSAIKKAIQGLELPHGGELLRVGDTDTFDVRDENGNIQPGRDAFVIWPMNSTEKVTAVFTGLPERAAITGIREGIIVDMVPDP